MPALFPAPGGWGVAVNPRGLVGAVAHQVGAVAHQVGAVVCQVGAVVCQVGAVVCQAGAVGVEHGYPDEYQDRPTLHGPRGRRTALAPPSSGYPGWLRHRGTPPHHGWTPPRNRQILWIAGESMITRRPW